MTDIVCFGDSITKGNNDAQGGWPQRVSNFLGGIYINDRRMPKHNVYNMGVDGDTTEELLKRIDPEISARSAFGAPIALISIGTNDSSICNGTVAVSGEDYARNLREILRTAQRLSREVAVIGLLPCQDDLLNPVSWSDRELVYSSKSLRAYSSLAKKVCDEAKIKFFDIYTIFGDLDLDIYLADGLHPNSVGQQYIADTVKKWVAEKANNYANT